MPILTTSIEDITETTVIWETSTSNSSDLPTSPPNATTSASGLYSFLVENGITIWLGGITPPATESFVVATATVVVEPVPNLQSSSSTVQVQAPIPVTSIETVQVTSVFTINLAEIPTESSSVASVSAAAKSFPGAGSNGWNVTTLTRVTHRKHETGTGYHRHATGASGGFAHHSLESYHWSNPIPSGEPEPKDKRQLGAIVTATIDGVIVSWTNTYDGIPQTVASIPSSSIVTYSVVDVSGKLSIFCSLQSRWQQTLAHRL